MTPAWAQNPRARVIVAAVVSAVLLTPLSIYLALLEQSEWSNNARPSDSWSLAAWLLPKVALLSFGLPHLVVVAMVARRSESVGFATVVVARCCRIAEIAILVLPIGFYFMPPLVSLLIGLFVMTLKGKAAMLVLIVALVGFYRLQVLLVRDGRTLRLESVPSAGRARLERNLAILLPIAYALFWVAALVYPELLRHYRV